MPRPTTTAALITIALLAAAPGAAAKEITGMEICGREGCAPFKKADVQRYHDDGALDGAALDRNPGPVPYYRLRLLIGQGDGPPVEVPLAYAPSLKAVLPLDAEPPVPWSRLADAVARRLDRRASGLTTFPAKQLRSATQPTPPSTPPPPKQDEEASGDGIPRPLIAGVPAVLLLGLGLVLLRRRPD
jgi:hypothetical protein